ncbi:diguanylate cyclase regulator RdcB family protein [Umezawaea sp. NPDC059074]|uniref:diguanylate cyclase regulator RdcB family protein n=1 Tax=Umezawaea sp. NPDC059074 TaxID=3346716 RepID=UPI0036A43032
MSTELDPYSAQARTLTADVPLLSDRVLVEVANRIGVVHDLTRHRAAETGASRVFSALVGADRDRQLRSIGALTTNQEDLLSWIVQVANATSVTAYGLERVARHVKQVRDLAQAAYDGVRQTDAELRHLATVVSEFAAACERRLRATENRVARLERAVDAADAFERTLGRWSTGLTYRRLPWLCQVVLIAREVLAGPYGRAHRVDGPRDRSAMIARLVGGRPAGLAGTHTYLDEMVAAVDSKNAAEVTTWLLEPELRIGPMTEAVVLALELAALPSPARLAEPGRTALSLVRSRRGRPSHSATAVDVATWLVDEQFAAALP